MLAFPVMLLPACVAVACSLYQILSLSYIALSLVKTKLGVFDRLCGIMFSRNF